MKSFLKSVINKIGFQITKYPSKISTSYLDHDLVRRQKIIKHFGINTVLDIGANNGNYATKLREYGYENKIISFEPLLEPFEELKLLSSKDSYWDVNNFAIGDTNSFSEINVAKNSLSSSLLNMLPAHLNSAPESGYIAKQKIEIKKLDSIFFDLCSSDDIVMVKIDTQGFEKKVIDGALNCLKKISILQLEMSLIPLYENEMLFMDMYNYIVSKGYDLYSLENGFADEINGRLLQVDAVFVNSNL